jgi:mannose-1-phosphate guanylyltransferase/phosphomannomutase
VRTKLDLHALTDAAATENAVLALDGRGGFILPEFQSMADGMMAIAKLMEWLSLRNAHLAHVVAGLPPWHVVDMSVSCSWEMKGSVMRKLHDQHKNQRTEAVDGLKVWFGDRQWVIIAPDPDRPLFHVRAEGETDAAARELAERYARVVESLKS